MIETREQLQAILKQEKAFYVPEASIIRKIKSRPGATNTGTAFMAIVLTQHIAL